MGLFSVLPEQLSTVETWVTRIFLLLGLLTIGPWALLLVYDFLFYLWRTATYEIPYVGGRARGRQPPKPPTLTERPSGRPRGFSMKRAEKDGGGSDNNNSNNNNDDDDETIHDHHDNDYQRRPRTDSSHDVSEKDR